MLERTIMSGFGGQGIISMGQIWVYFGMQEDKNVTYSPFYGAEKRGGIARASVIISDEEIASPIVTKPDSVVIMNNASLEVYENSVKPGGKIFLNSSLVTDEVKRTDVTVYKVPANELAEKVGTVKAANMVMLGALAKATGALSLEKMESILKKFFPESKHKFIPLNIQAIEEGMKSVDA